MFISLIQVNLEQLTSKFGNMLQETIISLDLVFMSLGFITTPILILKVLSGIPAECINDAKVEEEVQVHFEFDAVYSSLSGVPAFYLNER
jgi:hypothetical protein